MQLRTAALAALSASLLAISAPAGASLSNGPTLTDYEDEAAFRSAHPGLGFESFESVAGRPRSGNAVTAGGLTVTPDGNALLGVQTGSLSPEDGFGSGATHGSRYLFSYLANQPTGTLRFDFTTPTRAFGLNLTDIGEVAGEIQLQTDTSGLLEPLVVRSFDSGNLLPNGSVLFIGLSQDIPFSSVTLTITGNDDAYGLDKVYVQSVPEPGEWAMMLAGLVPLAVMARRRRRSAPGG